VSRQITVHRILLSAATVASGTLAAQEAFQLADYDVPVVLIIPCGTALFTTVLLLALRLMQAGATRVHRCTQPGCDFSVRLTHTDTGENRRWQEIAAHHPHNL
jgi:hypothetical protein